MGKGSATSSRIKAMIRVRFEKRSEIWGKRPLSRENREPFAQASKTKNAIKRAQTSNDFLEK